MSNLEEFKAQIKKYGVAHTNRFDVDIVLPQKLQELLSPSQEKEDNDSLLGRIGDAVNDAKKFLGYADAPRALNLMCINTSLPGINVLTTDREDQPTAYGVSFEEQEFTFLLANDMQEKAVFDVWTNLVIDRKSRLTEYFDNYVGTIVIHQKDKANRKIQSIRLVDCYPVRMNSLQVSSEDIDTLHKLTISFKYRRWEKEEDVNGASSALTLLSQTAIGPFIQPIINNPVVNRGLDILKANGLDLEGEALNVYNRIDEIVNTGGFGSTNELVSILNKYKVDAESNSRLNIEEKNEISNVITSILDAID